MIYHADISVWYISLIYHDISEWEHVSIAEWYIMRCHYDISKKKAHGKVFKANSHDKPFLKPNCDLLTLVRLK